MSLLKMSFSTGIIILVIVVIRRLLLHKLPKMTFLILWGVVLCRLLIPLSIPSKFSIFTIINILKNRYSEVELPLTEMPIASNNTVVAETVPTLPEAVSFISPALVIWLIGLLACALFFVITHLRCRREYRTALPIDNEFLNLWQSENSKRRYVQIRQSDMISAP
nr:M56 family metallopeptidase [uncultured Anaerocolumna sp.]